MSQETFEHEVWETGSDETKTTKVTFGAGQVLAARTPVGQRASDGLFYEYAPAATDGTEKPVYLTAYAVDTTAAAAPGQAIKSGTFNPDLVQWPGTATALQKTLAFVGTPISLQAPR